MKKLITIISFLALLLVSCKQETYYNITTKVEPEGSGSVVVTPSSGAVLEGTSVSFLAKPNGDYVFSGWSGGLSGDVNPQTVTVSSDLSVTAKFTLRSYPLTVTVEGEGTVSEKVISTRSDYTAGTVVELTANPSEHWVFDHWEGDLNGNTNPGQITVSSSKAVKAVFVKKMYDLTVEIQGQGSVEEKVIDSRSGSYEEGATVELTAIPDEYWAFDHWEGYMEGKDNPATISITEATKIKAVFVENDPGIQFTETAFISPQMLFEKLGWGFNLCCHLSGFPPDASHAQIPGWVNEQSLDQMMNTVTKMGVKTVRFQTTFCGELGPAPDFIINEDWLEKIDLYINTCDRYGLQVILNVMHEQGWDPSLFPNPLFVVDFEGASKDKSIYEYEKTRSNAIWLQLARRYRDRGDFLIFEPFNEPCVFGSDNAYPEVLNRLNQEFVNTVRSTGGNNASRWLSIPAWWCNAEDALTSLVLPQDYVSNNRLIVPFHYYGGLFDNERMVEWGHTSTLDNPDIWYHDEYYVKDLFCSMRERFIDNGIPVILGETGCFNGVNERQFAYEMYYLEYVFRCSSLNIITPLLHTVDGPRYYPDDYGERIEDGNYGFYDFEKRQYRQYGEAIQDILNKAFYTKDNNYTLEAIYQTAPFQNELPGFTIKDERLRSYLLDHFDLNCDGELTYWEYMRILDLDMSNLNISDMTDLSLLPNLRSLTSHGSENNPGGIQSLDISHYPKLQYLSVVFNSLSHLVLDNENLNTLICFSNQLKSYDFSKTPNITHLNCADNPVKELNLTCLPKLDWLDCCCMRITELDLSGNPLLRELRCHTNQLRELDLSHNPELTFLDCYSTPITKLDVTHNTKLVSLHLWDCPNLSVVYMNENQVIPDLIIDDHTKIVYK